MLVVLAFVAASFAVHADALGRGFTLDDPGILWHALRWGWLDPFTSASSYRGFSTANFTPMVLVSYRFDFALGALDPTVYYVHQLVVLGLVAGAIAAFVWRWGRCAAIAAGAWFLCSGPAVVDARMLMARHYLEGALLTLLAAIALRRAAARARPAWLAAGFWLLASSCKEVYVPFAVIAPWFLSGPWRARWRVVAPMACGVLLYVPWRLLMLGRVGGYGALVDVQTATDTLAQLGEVGRLAAGVSSPALVWVALLAPIVPALVLLRCAPSRLGLGVALAAALVVLLPVLSHFQPSAYTKYRMVTHGTVLVGVGLGCALAWSRGVQRVLCWVAALVWLAAVVVDMPASASAWIDAQRVHEAEVDFVLNERADKTLLTENPIAYDAPAVLRRQVRGESAPVACTPPFDLRDAPPTTYWRYDRSVDAFVEATAAMRAGCAQLRTRLRDEPFAVSWRAHAGLLEFELGGDPPGATFLLLHGMAAGVYQARPTPLRVTALVLAPETRYCRFARVDAQGNVSLSPEWTVHAQRDEEHTWGR